MSLFDNTFLPIKRALDQYVKNALEFLGKTGNKIAYNNISKLLASLDNLRYNITIVGSLKRGKSTLLNTLMERVDDNISPVDEDVCTSAIVKYLDKSLLKDNTREIAKVYFNNDKAPVEVPFENIRDYVVEANNPENIKNVKTVEVYGDFPQWSKAVTIIDSPGQNSTYEYQDELLTAHLPFTDAIIFLVASDLPLDAGDIKLLEALNKQQKNKIFFVLTKIDRVKRPADLPLIMEYVKNNIEDYISEDYNKQVYPVAAEKVFNAYKDNKPKDVIEKLKQENGIRKLEDDLEKFILKESDTSNLFISRCRDIINIVKENLNEFISANEELLRQDEFEYENFKKEKLNLIKQNDELKKELEKTLKTFEKKCNKTISDFEYTAKSKLNEVNKQIVSKIEADSFINSLYKTFNLQKEVEKIFYENYDSDLNKLNLELNSIQTEFTDEFENKIRIYKERLSYGQDKESLKKGSKTIALYGSAIAGGGTASVVAIGSAANSLTALAAAKAVQDGFFTWAWYKLVGGTSAATAATLAAKTTAIAAGVTAAVTVGASIGIAYIAQKITHKALKGQQENRIPELTEEYFETMLDNINKSLVDYKDLFVIDYRQNIDDFIEQNNNRIDEIEAGLSGKDLTKINSLKQQIKEAKELLGSSSDVVKSLPVS